MRIASLLPSATEIVCALGLADCLVGVSHECDYPADVVADLPRLTCSAVPHGLSSAEIDAVVSNRCAAAKVSIPWRRNGWPRSIRICSSRKSCATFALSPMMMCAVFPSVYPAIRKWSRWTPPDLDGIFADVETIAGAAGVEKRADVDRKFTGGLRSRCPKSNPSTGARLFVGVARPLHLPPATGRRR
ncbi:MAG: hypothetical protein R2911_39435 [Caldilineaceae bacterium]